MEGQHPIVISSEMNMKKYDYWFWENLVNENEIKQINLICEKNNESSFTDNNATAVLKTAEVRGIYWKFLKPKIFHVENIWREKNKEQFGFNIYQILDIDVWNFNIYDSKNQGQYEYHYDGTTNHISDIKLTGIVNISDESYEGGELIAFYNGEFKEIPQIKNPGSAVLLSQKTLHKVNPVTKGIRKTLSVWYYGPKFI